MFLHRYVGGCVPALLAAVAFDVAGLVLIFVGIFGDVRVRGYFYGDFLIYTGALVTFFSLFLWLLWYVGNVRVSSERERGGSARRASSVAKLARKISERLTRTLRVHDTPRKSSGGSAGPSACVAWGENTAYHNEAFEVEKEDLSSPPGSPAP